MNKSTPRKKYCVEQVALHNNASRSYEPLLPVNALFFIAIGDYCFKKVPFYKQNLHRYSAVNIMRHNLKKRAKSNDLTLEVE